MASSQLKEALTGLPRGSVPARPGLASAPIVCLSHLRWDFVFQRPQHLMTRLAARHAVLYVEEPVPTDGPARLELRSVAPNVTVARTHLAPADCTPGQSGCDLQQLRLLTPVIEAMEAAAGQPAITWYYTPMSLGVGAGVESKVVVYDCMDELANFRFAPPLLLERERALLRQADLVFTGGRSLYEAKRGLHADVHEFASSVDRVHFAAALASPAEPADLAAIAHPRVGYCGVIDERLDLDLLAAAAAARPDWQWVMLGPVVKIDPASLPRAANIHYLGGKRYEELPAYLGHWDAAMMPFALNDATRFISPTKTPEYVAAGLAVASTPVKDVVRGWGDSGLVHIAAGAAGFVEAVDAALAQGARTTALRTLGDGLLDGRSWDRTVADMNALIDRKLDAKRSTVVDTVKPVVPQTPQVPEVSA